MKKIILVLLFFPFLIFGQGNNEPKIYLDEVADGFTLPVDITHANDSRLFVVEKVGRIKIMYPDFSVEATPFLDIRSKVKSGPSEMGLLGLAFHPDFVQNGYFFVNYTNQNDESVLSRFRLDQSNVNLADPASETVLLTLSQPYNNHNGGDMAFGPDGYLYFSLGDGGSSGDPGNRSQDGQTLLGKILRLSINEVDTLIGTTYTIPTDNPFVNDADIADEIWSLGLRNPWRFSFDKQTGDMWIGDVGQGRFEEINFEPANTPGVNYGWRCFEGLNDFKANDCAGPSNTYVDPVFSYDHFDLLGSSITGGFVYRGSTYPNFQGYYIFGDYTSGNLWTLNQDMSGNFQSKFLGKRVDGGQLSSFGEDFQGEIYLTAYNQGKIFQIKDSSQIATSLSPKVGQASLSARYSRAKEKITLRLSEGLFQAPQLGMFTLNGQQVQAPLRTSPYKLEVATQGLPTGLYLLKLDMDGKQWVRKIWLR